MTAQGAARLGTHGPIVVVSQAAQLGEQIGF